jgi:phosphoglycolate phosphatase
LNRLQAVLFDLDGTLLNTLDDLGDCMNRVLDREGLPPHPIDAYRFFVGQGMENLIIRVLPEGKRNPALIQRVRQQMEAEYSQHWADKTELYPGVAGVLDELAARRLRLGILSNKPHSFTRVIVERYFQPWRFDPVLGARDGVPRKPDPTAALEICASWRLDPQQVLYAGDSGTDMQTACRAGMFALGVLWGFRPREELLDGGARELAENPIDLLRFFQL